MFNVLKLCFCCKLRPGKRTAENLEEEIIRHKYSTYKCQKPKLQKTLSKRELNMNINNNKLKSIRLLSLKTTDDSSDSEVTLKSFKIMQNNKKKQANK